MPPYGAIAGTDEPGLRVCSRRAAVAGSSSMVFGRSGDGFVRCSDGQVRWGRFGAAGVVFLTRADGALEIMLQLRSGFAHEGGTWSCAGGALDEGESPLDAALREAGEEVGEVPEPFEVLGAYDFVPATDWRYTTIVVEVPHRFGTSMNFETDAVAWIRLDDVEARPLHPGFAAAWPHLRAIIEPGSGSSAGDSAV